MERKFKNKTIYSGGRYWTVNRCDDFLEVFFVTELDRNFRTCIAYEELNA